MSRWHTEHGPNAVRRELQLWDDEGKVPRHWIRLAMAGCRECGAWKAGRRRLATLHRAYRRRRA